MTPELLYSLSGDKKKIARVQLGWMTCPSCKEALILVNQKIGQWRVPGRGEPQMLVDSDDSWFAIPRTPAGTTFPEVVTEPIPRDFHEAEMLLDLSPRMSAVLSRSILEALLFEYCGLSQYKLQDRIAAFEQNTAHPKRIRDVLDGVRKIGNLAVHQKVSAETGEIVGVTRDEAGWLLEVVRQLIDYLIVDPAKAKALTDQINAKDAGAARDKGPSKS